MKNSSLIFVFTFFLFFVNQLFAYNVEDKLKEIKDLKFEKVTTPDGFVSAYKVFIKQPIDHNDFSKGYFNQKIWLTHSDIEKPTVIATEGYESDYNYLYEPTLIIKANQLDVEHRFFGESIPEGMDYKYLTIEQATADLHRIREIFTSIYQKNWISTGISKGGETTVYYRYFFPKDVTVSIPYVAPLALELDDKRIYHFFDTVNTPDCRQQVYDLQMRVLENRKKSMRLLKKEIKNDHLDFNYLTFEQAFEYTVLEYSFSFWQWNGKCDKIPGKEASLKETIEYFNTVSGIEFFSDSKMKELGSHYYQSGTQLGYYSYETKDFEGLLPALTALYGKNITPTAIFMPQKNMVKTFDPILPQKVFEWATTQGNQIIYINGAGDPWASTAIPKSSKPDAIWFFLKDKHHGQARYVNMTLAEKELFISSLERWLKMEI
jgi:hypothetical protein